MKPPYEFRTCFFSSLSIKWNESILTKSIDQRKSNEKSIPLCLLALRQKYKRWPSTIPQASEFVQGVTKPRFAEAIISCSFSVSCFQCWFRSTLDTFCFRFARSRTTITDRHMRNCKYSFPCKYTRIRIDCISSHGKDIICLSFVAITGSPPLVVCQ